MKRQTMFMIAGLVFLSVLLIRDLFDTWDIVKATFVAVNVVILISLVYGMRITHMASSAVQEVKDHLMSMEPQMIVIKEANLMLDDKEICDTLAKALKNPRPKDINEARVHLLLAKARHEEAKALYTFLKAKDIEGA